MADTKISLLDATNKDALQVLIGAARKWCRLYLNANQSISNTTATAINWTAEAFDPQSIIAVPQAYVVVPTGMTQCRVTATACFAGNTTGGRNIYVQRQNSSGVAQELLDEVFSPGAGTATRINVATGWFDTAAAERIVVGVYQESGGALNLIGSSTLTASRTQAFFEFR